DVTKIASSDVVRPDDYEISDLHIILNRVNLRSGYPTAWDNANWVFAFGVKRDISNPVQYAFYIDTDHIVGSGATSDLMGKPITVTNLYRPDYMIIVERETDNQLTPADVTVYAWSNGAWAPGQTLTALGGDAWFSEGGIDPGDEAIQFLVPLTAIGTSPTSTDDFSGSLAVALISTSQDPAEGIFDSIPPQRNNVIDAPALVSNMLLPLYPFDTPLTNPIVQEDMPPLRWRMPEFSSNDGYELQIARDAKFTDLVEEWEINELRQNVWYPFLTTTFQSLSAYEDNETYYWRIRLRHERYDSNSSRFDYGYWSSPMRFKLSSRKVGNPTLSTGNLANTTPSFWWDRVEGAAGYTIQVDNDSNFSSPIINAKIDGTSYTPLEPLKDGTYYWRVAMRRSNSVVGQWTQTMTFVKQSMAPTPLSPINNQVINEQPTFKWTAVLTPTNEPRVAAPLYRLQIDEDSQFGSPATFSTQATSFTIPGSKSLFDGNFYWRVAAVDADGNVGTYSETQTFYKEYLTPVPIAPIGNAPFTKATSFAWEPLDGASYYEIEIADEPQYAKPVVSDKTANTVYTPIKDLTAAQYYWRVRMYDYDNNPGPWYGGLVNVEDVIQSLGNYVWIDNNNNGVVDSGEDPVPDGVLLELLDGAGAPLDRSVTTTNGFYLFNNLGSGEYRVRLAASNFGPDGLLKNYSHSSGAAQEGDPNANGDQNDNGLDLSDPVVDGITSAKIGLTESEEPTGETPTAGGNPGDDGNATKDANSNLTLDFGVVSPEHTYSIGNFVGLDANNDGQIDLDDENKPIGLPTGVLLELLHGDGTPTGRTTTTQNGYYIFAGLPKGSYRVRIAASNFISGGLLEYYGHSTGEFQEDNPNNHGDQNDNGLNGSIPRSDGISSDIIELGDDEPMGETTTSNELAGSDGRGTPDAHSDLTIDFALVRTVPTAAEDNFIFLPIVSR
ncbi:MAG: hypothetical protein KDE19_20995, partial [Caldilineaceae bacterium]|nr:hypothetical protein [Caldilineaceae bacterium]